jgi:hypothetical protein
MSVDISDFVTLARIFKHGFAIHIINNEIHQMPAYPVYHFNSRSFITIHAGKSTYHNGRIPDNCVVVGFPVAKSDVYRIEVVV